MEPLALKLTERFTYGEYRAWDDGERWDWPISCEWSVG